MFIKRQTAILNDESLEKSMKIIFILNKHMIS